MSLILRLCAVAVVAGAWKHSAAAPKWLKSGLAALVIATSSMPVQPSAAFGPTDVQLKIVEYKLVELCNGQKPIMPGQKAMEGMFPICIEVTAEVNNPTDATLKDVSIYGFVKENDAGNSVLPNNPDFKSDSGQYAMIKTVAPGPSTVSFQFVGAISADPKKDKIPELTFFKTKARAFPGGDKFQPLSDCELDPRNCAAEEDD